ncbi:MAG: hypothetical protein K0S28_1801 [Paucimonas sp.]|jgi:hypothetical protein|nr:hypothetical protein [Paucimonas sp.]
MLREYVQNFDASRYGIKYGHSNHKPVLEKRRNAWFATIAAVFNLATPAQQKASTRKLQKRIDEFNVLAMKP